MPRRPPRLRNVLRSIHDPPDPSPRSLPDAAKREWGHAYQEAYEVYGKDDLAARAAWREVRLAWKNTGKKTWQRCKNGLCAPWPKAQMLPEPQEDLVALGVLVEYSFIDANGNLQIRETDENHPPILWWDEGRKALYAFPKAPYPMCQPIPSDMRKAVEVYRRWHQRDPQCYDEISIPAVTVRAIGAADTVSYRSDKWHEADEDPRVKNAQEYIHNHWYDVWAWQDRDTVSPNVIMIEGGELDLHERGLIH